MIYCKYESTDEETGGIAGMKIFVHTDEFKALNVGFSLDEGLASVDEVFPVYYAERSIWSIFLRYKTKFNQSFCKYFRGDV